MNKTQFRYGDPLDPREDDPRFDTMEHAIEAVYRLEGATWDNVVAIWNDEPGEIVCLIFCGIEFRPFVADVG